MTIQLFSLRSWSFLEFRMKQARMGTRRLVQIPGWSPEDSLRMVDVVGQFGWPVVGEASLVDQLRRNQGFRILRMSTVTGAVGPWSEISKALDSVMAASILCS